MIAASVTVPNHDVTQLEVEADGTWLARCPKCGTPSAAFRPMPGLYLKARCPRRDCRALYYVVVVEAPLT